MSNFLKELTRCENTILNECTSEYSDETLQILKELIRCIQSGVLCKKSESDRFICKHYKQNSSSLVMYWRIEGHGEKSDNTFRCQIHNLSKKLYMIFGSDIFDSFYSQNMEQLHMLNVKLQALSFQDVYFEDIFFSEISQSCKCDAKKLRYDVEVKDCVDELKLLRQLKGDRFKSVLATKDAEKLCYIKNVLNKPLIDNTTKQINEEKLKMLYALGLLGNSASKGERAEAVCN